MWNSDTGRFCVVTKFLHITSHYAECHFHASLWSYSRYFSSFTLCYNFWVHKLRSSTKEPTEFWKEFSKRLNELSQKISIPLHLPTHGRCFVLIPPSHQPSPYSCLSFILSFKNLGFRIHSRVEFPMISFGVVRKIHWNYIMFCLMFECSG